MPRALKHMWQKLSIKTQLMIWITAVSLMIASGSLGVAFWLDAKQRQTLAIELSETINKSLRHDLLKGIISTEASVYSDLNFRLSGFTQIERLLLLDDQNRPVFTFNNSDEDFSEMVSNSTETPQFSGVDLYVRHPLIEDGYRFGSAVYIIDTKSFSTQFQKHLIFLILAFPIEILFAILLTWGISRSYNKPFTQLAQAMQRNDINQNHFEQVQTSAQNEIGNLFSGYNQMIQQIEATSEQMRYKSEHDDLTGLYNRYYIDQVLQSALQDEQAQSHVLLLVDLDQFKLINDSVGHSAGDEVLKMVAHGCQTELPENAIIARVGGDDFYILFQNTDAQTGEMFARQRLERLSDFRFVWEGQALSVSGSIGMVAFKPFEYTLEELIKVADSAFYAAKNSGHNRLHIYHPEDETSRQFNREVQVAAQINDALSGNDSGARFELFAQPIVPLQYTSDMIGYEILIRMWDAENNFIPPNDFLPTAERYQLMADIDIYVLSTFLKMATDHPEHINKLHVAHINLAGSTLNHSGFQEVLRKLVAQHQFPWQKLELEVTETSAVGNFTQATEFIRYCKNLGIGLALDDFGTGMSSFEYLKSLPFDVVKIDGSFVKDMHTDPSDKAVIRYIQEICELRNQETVAEYVETQQDVDELTQIGITYGQGYFLGKPEPFRILLNPDSISDTEKS